MAPKVRLPLVELADQSKADVAAVMGQVCNGYADYVIGKMCGAAHDGRRAVAG
jgi:hypothetical protein